MDNDSPAKAILVVTITALVCSVLVSGAAVFLQPLQQAYADIERIRYIVQISGLVDSEAELSEFDIVSAYRDISLRLIDLDSGSFDTDLDPQSFIDVSIENELQESVNIPAAQDTAALQSRPRWVAVYLVESDAELQRIIFPIYGRGMWSTIYGYLAIEGDLSTIAGVVFYEHGETPGIGDQIQRASWLAGWRGKRLYDEQRQLQFNIGTDSAASPAADYRVDGIAGATLTVNGVANMVRYWFGPHGYAPFMNQYLAELNL